MPLSIARGIIISMSDSEKVRENRLRRMADRRQHLNLRKSRRTDRQAYDFGNYWLESQDRLDDDGRPKVVFGDRAGRNRPMTLDDIEDFLTGVEPRVDLGDETT